MAAESYIYIPANSSEGMIDDLNSRGIRATDCNTSALPVIKSYIYDSQERESYNFAINPDHNHGFVRRDGKFYFADAGLAKQNDERYGGGQTVECECFFCSKLSAYILLGGALCFSAFLLYYAYTHTL